jgi:hypothetical protein
MLKSFMDVSPLFVLPITGHWKSRVAHGCPASRAVPVSGCDFCSSEEYVRSANESPHRIVNIYLRWRGTENMSDPGVAEWSVQNP